VRPFEILLLAANLPPLLWPLLSRRKRPRWIDFLPLVAVLLLLIHLIREGYRWQMVPAYALTGLAFLLTVWRAFRPGPVPADKPVSRWRKAFSIPGHLLGLLLLAVAAALAAILPVPRLPDLTGPYPVGTVSYHWIDPSRDEIYTDDPSDRREIMVQLWYPAEPMPGATPVPYLPDVAVAGPAIARVLGLPSFVLGHLGLVRTHALPGAEVSAARPGYPVLIFSHGLTGYRTQNTIQAEELASHGYVVVAIDHTYAAAVTVFPDGRTALYNPDVLPDGLPEEELKRAANRLVSVWAADVRFVLDQLETFDAGNPDSPLAGRLDLERIGVFGHSTGGGTAVEACALDRRCKAGLGMDAWVVPVSDDVVAEGLEQPFMFMRSETWAADENNDRLMKVYRGLGDGGYLLTVQGSRHFDFCDLPLLSPIASSLGLKGPIDGRRVLRIVGRYSLAFFDRHLKNQDAPLLDAPSPDYPEVLFYPCEGCE